MIQTKEKNAKKKNNEENISKERKNEQQTEQEQNKKNNMTEKKIIVYIIVSVILLLYVAQLQMHDIIDRGVISKSQELQIIYPDRNNNNNNNNENKGNNTDTPDTPDNPETPENPDTPIIDNEARIRIMEGTTNWNELKELDIFDTSKNTHVTSGKIAPGAQGMYTYTVENYGKTAMKYNLNYSDENKYNINMVFKLKRNGTYIAGGANKWVKINELSQTDLTIQPDITDIYQLEWRWEDAENDTEIGKTEGAYYKIFINSTATEI